MPRRIAPLIAALVLNGCATIDYHREIRAVASLGSVPNVPKRLNVDFQASYVEVVSDAGGPPLPSTRFDRVELLSAISAAWEGSSGSPGPGEAAPAARVILLASIKHGASDVLGEVLHGITVFATAFLGVPLACASSDVTLVVQTKGGGTFAGQGTGHACLGFYYLGDHKMRSLAAGIENALRALHPLAPGQLATLVPTLPEIPERSQGALSGPFDRLYWPVQPTRSFPAVWGDPESPQ